MVIFIVNHLYVVKVVTFSRVFSNFNHMKLSANFMMYNLMTDIIESKTAFLNVIGPLYTLFVETNYWSVRSMCVFNYS